MRSMISAIALCLSAQVLAQPANYVDQIKAELSAGLRDADSARDLVICAPTWSDRLGAWVVYFSINARNGFGGYSGARPFSATFVDGRMVDFGEVRINRDIDAKMLEMIRDCPKAQV